MRVQEITSLQHPTVKYCVELRKDRTFRQKEGRALIAGSKLVGDIAMRIPLKMLFVEQGIKTDLTAPQTFVVPHDVLKKITSLEHPDPIAAIVDLPKPPDISRKDYVIVLDGISDPGNLGTLLRTALALGWQGALITQGSVDPFNDKALRAAQGATFFLPLQMVTQEELIELIAKRPFHAFIADGEGPAFTEVALQKPLMLFFGSEGSGVSAALKNLYPAISIPMRSDVESLNVAAAGAILMYACRGAL